MTLVRSKFAPFEILAEIKQGQEESKTDVESYEAIWVFEMIGRQFEQVKNPLEIGVLDTNKCFYIIFYKAHHLAIYLWMGGD